MIENKDIYLEEVRSTNPNYDEIIFNNSKYPIVTMYYKIHEIEYFIICDSKSIEVYRDGEQISIEELDMPIQMNYKVIYRWSSFFYIEEAMKYNSQFIKEHFGLLFFVNPNLYPYLHRISVPYVFKIRLLIDFNADVTKATFNDAFHCDFEYISKLYMRPDFFLSTQDILALYNAKIPIYLIRRYLSSVFTEDKLSVENIEKFKQYNDVFPYYENYLNMRSNIKSGYKLPVFPSLDRLDEIKIITENLFHFKNIIKCSCNISLLSVGFEDAYKYEYEYEDFKIIPIKSFEEFFCMTCMYIRNGLYPSDTTQYVLLMKCGSYSHILYISVNDQLSPVDVPQGLMVPMMFYLMDKPWIKV